MNSSDFNRTGFNSPDFNYHGDVVAFDLDDTLFRERDYVRSGFRLIESLLINDGYRAAGIAAELTEILQTRGKYFDRLEDWLNSVNAPADKLLALIDIYRKHQPSDIRLADGAGLMLEELSRRGVVMGLITDGRSATQRAKIKALGLERFFRPDNILISEETGHDKTTPHNFRHFVTQYPEAKRFFYIGDNERKDFRLPNLLGWITVRPDHNPDNVHEDFINPDILSRPNYILPVLSDFLAKFQPKSDQ